MTNNQFRAIRLKLGLTQAQLAEVLGYETALTISTYERESNPRNIPHHVEMLMIAFRDGYRPKHWPSN